MRRAYKMCRQTVEDNTLSIWKAMSEEEKEDFKQSHNVKGRRAYDVYLHNSIVREMDTRDREWLRTGKAPKVTFETSALEKEIKEKRPHEIATANRLVQQGVRADFRVDHLDNYPKKGLTKSFADLKNGVELKTFTGNYTLNTVDDYIRTSDKKAELNAIVFDNTSSTVPDEILKKYILKSRNSKGKIYILSNNGYWLVK